MSNAIFATIDSHINFKKIVVIPFIILAIYYLLIAADRYTSEAIVTIKENSANTTGMDIAFLGIGGGASKEDEYIIQEYLQSFDVLEYQDEKLDARQHYQNSSADWFSALTSNATKEEYLQYFRDHISIELDDTTGLMHIEVQAFEPDYAKSLLELLIKHTEEVVNTISHDLASAQLGFVEKQLHETQESLKQAKQNILVFQNKYQIFSPEQQSQTLNGIMDGLEGELSKEKAKLKELLSFQKKGSPQVVASEEKIKALTKQIADEMLRLVGSDEQSLNDLMAQYTNLELELEFAKNAYATALAAMEQSRAEASKKIKHLVIVSKPSLAEEAKYPRRAYILATALIVFMMIFGILRMTISTIREHQD